MSNALSTLKNHLFLTLTVLLFLLPTPPTRAAGPSTIIYNNPNLRMSYGRIMEFRYSDKNNGNLLATFAEYNVPDPVFMIYKSTDKGKTWNKIGEVKDTQHNWGMKFQPMLFEMPHALGKLNKGTLLCAGNSIPQDLSKTSLDLYRSDDGGVTWTFMSTVCAGGRAVTSGADPVWEPFLMLDKKGRLVCYESDERYKPDHNQLLCHFVSEDAGYTWGPQINDVAVGDLRPGMVIIAPLPNAKYIMTYEMVRQPGNPVTFKLSDDADDWGGAANLGTQIITAEGYRPGSTPYNVWAPTGGKNGTIIVSGMRGQGDNVQGDFVVNYNNGEGPWYRMRTPIRFSGMGGYSRAMTVASNGKELYSVVPIANPVAPTTTAPAAAVATAPATSTAARGGAGGGGRGGRGGAGGGGANLLNITFFRIPLELAFDWSYAITSGNSFKLLTAENANVTQQPAKEDPTQKWTLTDTGDGYCKLVTTSGRVLEVQGQSTADGARIVTGDKADRDSQKWRIRYTGEGFYTLANKQSGKFLTVTANSKDDGATLQQSADNSSAAAKWRIDAIDTPDAWATPDLKWIPNVYSTN